jgi:hypothetical protein
VGIDGKVKNMKHWEKKASGWVFLSHASDDYEDVKIIRNYLEDNGFSALMFYLKCLEDDDKKDKIKELIEWEIDARNIFVLCNSVSASKSKWVKWETDYVKSLPSKIIKEIDIQKLKYQKCTQLSKLDDLMNVATLYFSYSRIDKPKVNIIYEKLSSLGFRIFDDTVNMKLGNDIESKAKMALQETIGQGAVLMFLSKNAKESKWFWKEKSIALNKKAFIIPIVLDDIGIYEFPAFENLQYIDMSKNITDEMIEKLIRIINTKEI